MTTKLSWYLCFFSSLQFSIISQIVDKTMSYYFQYFFLSFLKYNSLIWCIISFPNSIYFNGIRLNNIMSNGYGISIVFNPGVLTCGKSDWFPEFGWNFFLLVDLLIYLFCQFSVDLTFLYFKSTDRSNYVVKLMSSDLLQI